MVVVVVVGRKEAGVVVVVVFRCRWLCGGLGMMGGGIGRLRVVGMGGVLLGGWRGGSLVFCKRILGCAAGEGGVVRGGFAVELRWFELVE